MIHFLLRRFGVTILVLATVSAISFGLVHLSGDPAVSLAGEGASEEDLARVRRQFGLDRPLLVQYGAWLANVLSGEFGYSHYLKGHVAGVLAEHLPVTMGLGFAALLFATALALPLGVAAALRPNSWIDRLALTIAVVGQSAPSFVVAYFLIYLFAVHLRLVPVTPTGNLLDYVLPVVTLGYYATPAMMRLTRASMIDALDSDYVRMARAKGMSETSVVLKHALRNALVPVIALAAVQFGFMLGGSVVVETIFSVNGIGHLAWQSIQRADFEVIQGIVLVVAIFYSLLTLLADVINALVDPRLRVR